MSLRKSFSFLGEFSEEEIELLNQFRRISNGQRKLALKQVKSIADFGEE